MKKQWIAILLSAGLTLPAFARFSTYKTDSLAVYIKSSDKKYKIIYIFCHYCYASQMRFSKVAALLSDRNNIAFFPICAQDTAKLTAYADTCQYIQNLYIFNQDRKKKWIDFYNPNDAACKFLEKYLNVNSKRMGASDFCILDKNNHILETTNWDTKDAEYFNLLSEYLKNPVQNK